MSNDDRLTMNSAIKIGNVAWLANTTAVLFDGF